MRERYNPKRKCPKCGFRMVNTNYCNGGYGCVRHPFEDGEHIDRRCQRCGYAWAEDCLSKERLKNSFDFIRIFAGR